MQDVFILKTLMSMEEIINYGNRIYNMYKMSYE